MAPTPSVWIAASGCVACARRIVFAPASDSPIAPTLPCSISCAIAATTDLQAGVERRTEASEAWAAVDRLPADRRRALILRFVDEMSTQEIAGVLGRSEGAVRVLIHRALRSVARDLGVDGR